MENTRTQTLKPGLLVSLASSIKGNVKYARIDIEAEHRTEDGQARAKWETEKVVRDPEEQERAERVRSEARQVITRVCSWSSFGLLCPIEKRAELDEAAAIASRMVRDFNRDAKQTTVRVNVLCGTIASTDQEAARALNRELVDLINEMQEGIAAANPGAIREAAKKAKLMEGMLTEGTNKRVNDAISQARKAARELVRRVEKGAERAADVIAEINTDALRTARMAFLDLDEEQEGEAAEAIAREVEMQEPEAQEPEEMTPEDAQVYANTRDMRDDRGDLFTQDEQIIPTAPRAPAVEID